MARTLTPRLRAMAHATLVFGLMLQTWMLYRPIAGEALLPHNSDKVGHAFMFGLPAGLALWLGYRWAPLLLAWYAPVSELIQGTSWVGRDSDIHDVVADITGILLVCGFLVVRRRRRVA